MIYELAFTDPNGVSLVSKTKARRRTVRRGRVYNDDDGTYWYGRRRVSRCDVAENVPKVNTLIPNLLAVNKQIHNEAMNVLYGQELIFEDTVALHRFLATIGHRNQQRLVSIDLKTFAYGRRKMPVNHCAFALLGGATNLKSIKMPSNRGGWYGGPLHHAQGIYRDMHFFLEAFGDANGRKDAAVDIMQISEDNFEGYYGSSWRRRRSKDPEGSPSENERTFKTELRRLLAAR